MLLADYLRDRAIDERDNAELFFLTTHMGYRPYGWNRAALEQLKADGGLRRNASVTPTPASRWLPTRRHRRLAVAGTRSMVSARIQIELESVPAESAPVLCRRIRLFTPGPPEP